MSDAQAWSDFCRALEKAGEVLTITATVLRRWLVTQLIAMLDCLVGFARLARERDYHRPTVEDFYRRVRPERVIFGRRSAQTEQSMYAATPFRLLRISAITAASAARPYPRPCSRRSIMKR